MEGYTATSFGALNAADYDAVHDPGTTDDAVAFLGELAGGRKTLELAIGTGRIALPLARAEIDIEGIDASPDMVAKLREKPGGTDIEVTIGDMAEVVLPRRFGFVFLVFNTLFNLTTQDAQVRCFQNAAEMLEPGGQFLVEAFVPDLVRIAQKTSVHPKRFGPMSVTLSAARYDLVEQLIESQDIAFGPSGSVKVTPLPLRYAFVSEIDLMARLAGLALEDRWGGWKREPFTAASTMHVSLYRKPG